MYKKVVTILISCIIVAVFITYQSNQKLFGASDTMPTKWEYNVLVSSATTNSVLIK